MHGEQTALNIIESTSEEMFAVMLRFLKKGFAHLVSPCAPFC